GRQGNLWDSLRWGCQVGGATVIPVGATIERTFVVDIECAVAIRVTRRMRRLLRFCWLCICCGHRTAVVGSGASNRRTLVFSTENAIAIGITACLGGYSGGSHP